jgi:hypothetical protein
MSDSVRNSCCKLLGDEHYCSDYICGRKFASLEALKAHLAKPRSQPHVDAVHCHYINIEICTSRAARDGVQSAVAAEKGADVDEVDRLALADAVCVTSRDSPSNSSSMMPTSKQSSAPQRKRRFDFDEDGVDDDDDNNDESDAVANNDEISLSKVETTLVSQLVYAAASNTPLNVIGSPLHAAYVASLGGICVDHSRAGLLGMLPSVFEAVESLSCTSSALASVGCIAVDGWSSAKSMPIVGMTVSFLDEQWNMCTVPLGLLSMDELEKTAVNQAAAIKALLAGSKRLDKKFVVHSGVSDNEASTANAVDIVTNYSGALRCLVHTLSLVIKDDVFKAAQSSVVGAGNIGAILERAHKVGVFVSSRPNVEAMLRDDQIKHDKVTPDRVATLKLDMSTRWHAQLTVLESYVSLHSNLRRVLARLHTLEDDAAASMELLTSPHMSLAEEVVIVLNEMRRVSRALEADKFVTASRAARLLWELHETMTFWSTNTVPTRPRNSTAGDDKALLKARQRALSDSDARELAADIATALKQRVGHLWCKADDVIGKEADDGVQNFKEKRRALLFHLASMVDVNECALDWLAREEREAYYKKLYKAMALDKAQLDYAASDRVATAADIATNEQLFGRVHASLLASMGDSRGNVDLALQWWRGVEANPRGHKEAMFFTDSARAFLAMQASSASAERLFSDAGNIVEGAMRHNQSTATLEMNVVVRAFVKSELGGLANASIAPAYQNLVKKNAAKVASSNKKNFD